MIKAALISKGLVQLHPRLYRGWDFCLPNEIDS